MALKINEIFYSIQGESTWAGQKTVFVRTSGCHLRCTYCDTTYAYYEGHPQSIDQIIQEIKKHPTKFVCVTGGEPLLQKDVYGLMNTLCDQGYNVSLETSGDILCDLVDSRVKKVIDVKTPDSGEAGRFHQGNIDLADANTEYKFVICSEEDFVWASDFVERHELFLKSTIHFSPSFEKISAEWLAEKILAQASPIRLQLQQHKYIWLSTTRGV